MTDDERATQDEDADLGIRREEVGPSAGSVSTGGMVSPSPSGGSGDRGQDGTETETGPGPQTDWLREAQGESEPHVPGRKGAADPPRDALADAARKLVLDDRSERSTFGAIPEPDEPPVDRS
jgi:hypothetical protein